MEAAGSSPVTSTGLNQGFRVSGTLDFFHNATNYLRIRVFYLIYYIFVLCFVRTGSFIIDFVCIHVFRNVNIFQTFAYFLLSFFVFGSTVPLKGGVHGFMTYPFLDGFYIKTHMDQY